jgi:hypothetical protein
VKANSDNDAVRDKGADLGAKYMTELMNFHEKFASLVRPYVKMHQKAAWL